MKTVRTIRATRWLLGWTLLLGCLGLGGCANLAAVRSFAKTSAATANYQQVVADFASSARRNANYRPESPYITATPQSREEVRRHFEQVQTVVVDYLNALGELAADAPPRVDDEVKGLVGELKKSKFVGQGDRQAGLATLSAAGALASSLANLAIRGRRELMLRELIKANDDSLQLVVKGLANVVGQDFVGSLEEEQETANSYFQKVRDRATDQAVAEFLTRFARIEHDEATNARIAQARAYAQVLTKIGAGHAQLRADLNNLKAKSVQASLQQYTEELQNLYQAIHDLKH